MATGPPQNAVASLKSKLRDRVLRRRAKVDPARRERLATLLAQIGPRLVQGHDPDGETCIVSLFTSIASEPDPTALAAALRQIGTELVLPVDWSHGAPLVYRVWNPGDRLAHGPLGIAEPLAKAPERDPDVLFIPVVAFDRRGYRLGYGAGNVDRTLSGLRKRKSILVIGVGYASQEVAMVPAEAHDEKLDLVVTERGLVAVAGRRDITGLTAPRRAADHDEMSF